LEELILIVVIALMALIAMSQGAHYSSRRHETSHLPRGRYNHTDASPPLPVKAVVEHVAEPAVSSGTERESTSTKQKPTIRAQR
jgi:hypothetical protein